MINIFDFILFLCIGLIGAFVITGILCLFEEIIEDIKEYNKLRKLQKKLESQEQEIEKLNKLVFNFETIKEFKESENLQNDNVRTKHSRKNRSTNKNGK